MCVCVFCATHKSEKACRNLLRHERLNDLQFKYMALSLSLVTPGVWSFRGPLLRTSLTDAHTKLISAKETQHRMGRTVKINRSTW